MEKTRPVDLPAHVESGEFGILDILIVLAKHKRMILGFTATVAVLAALVSLALTDVYKSNTRILPPQQSQSGASALLSQLGGVAGLAAGVGGFKTPNDLYVGILKSRRVADKLIAEFDLKRSYELESLEKTRQVLSGNTSIVVGKDGLINIEVEDEDRNLAAQIANGYVRQLTDLTRVLAVTEASHQRLFFQRELERAKDNLADAEIMLKGSLKTNGVISVDSDSRAVVALAAQLRARISAAEIRSNAMSAFVTSSNPEYIRLQEELRSLRRESARLENGTNVDEVAGKPGENSSGLQNMKLLRDVKYYQMLYELLAKQYEVARLDEAKNGALIQVLDVAVPAEKKAKPSRLLIVLLAAALSLVATVFWAFAIEARRKTMQSEAGLAQWNELRSLISKT